MDQGDQGRLFHPLGLRRLVILRPYGRIAPLPPGGAQGTEFGDDVTRVDLLPLIANIKTFTEQIEDEDLLTSIRSAVAEAETIAFLGFGFHPQNLDLIAPKTPPNAKRVFASAHGISNSDRNDIVGRLNILLKHPLTGQVPVFEVRNDLKCVDLFNEYSRNLSA